MSAPVYDNILLWRHADALPLNAHCHEDINRPLSKKGIHQAHKIAQWLDLHLPKKTVVISSKALRARQTAQALNRKHLAMRGLNPGASFNSILESINNASKDQTEHLTLLLVGHQPWLGVLADYLLHATEPLSNNGKGISIKKGAVLWFKRSKKEPNTKFDLISIQTPSLI